MANQSSITIQIKGASDLGTSVLLSFVARVLRLSGLHVFINADNQVCDDNSIDELHSSESIASHLKAMKEASRVELYLEAS